MIQNVCVCVCVPEVWFLFIFLTCGRPLLVSTHGTHDHNLSGDQRFFSPSRPSGDDQSALSLLGSEGWTKLMPSSACVSHEFVRVGGRTAKGVSVSVISTCIWVSKRTILNSPAHIYSFYHSVKPLGLLPQHTSAWRDFWQETSCV